MTRVEMYRIFKTHCNNTEQCTSCPLYKNGECWDIDFQRSTKKQLKHALKQINPQAFCKTIHVKYFTDGLKPIEKITVGDWIDLRAAEDVEMRAGEYRLISLGVGMILPEGYEAWVVPRSSTPSKFGVLLANSIGIIDNSYSGDNDQWCFPALAIRDTVIHKNDRICQFRIMKNMPFVRMRKVDHLNSVDRGGIGSTGTN